MIKKILFMVSLMTPFHASAEPLKIQYKLDGGMNEATMDGFSYNYPSKKIILSGGNGFTPINDNIEADYGDSLTFVYNATSIQYLLKLSGNALEYEGLLFDVKYVGWIVKNDDNIFYFDLVKK